MSNTIVSTTDIHVANSRDRQKVMGFRASHGNITNYNSTTIQLAKGEEQTFEFNQFMYCYIRDITTLAITDANNNTVIFPNAVGAFSLPFAGKINVSVPSDSTIDLERVIRLLYS